MTNAIHEDLHESIRPNLYVIIRDREANCMAFGLFRNNVKCDTRWNRDRHTPGFNNEVELLVTRVLKLRCYNVPIWRTLGFQVAPKLISLSFDAHLTLPFL